MKKFRLILLLLTVAAGIYMLYANISVMGYRLLTMNSAAGYRVAVTYRWSRIVFGILVVLNILIGVWNRIRKKKKAVCPACGAVHRESDKFCKKCGHSFQKR